MDSPSNHHQHPTPRFLETHCPFVTFFTPSACAMDQPLWISGRASTGAWVTRRAWRTWRAPRLLVIIKEITTIINSNIIIIPVNKIQGSVALSAGAGTEGGLGLSRPLVQVAVSSVLCPLVLVAGFFLWYRWLFLSSGTRSIYSWSIVTGIFSPLVLVAVSSGTWGFLVLLQCMNIET